MKPFDGLTKAQLIEELEGFPDDTPIGFAYPSGDYWGTVLIRPIRRSLIEVGTVKWSQYHNKFQCSDGDDEGESTAEVIIIQ